MQIIENLKIKEKVYTEKLENGLMVMVIPRENTNKKYAIFGTHFGSIDNHFIRPGDEEETIIPNGVAHFLEHKMFEQPDGTNSLDTLSALGVDANAYTTNDHTAYLFECTNHFEEALDELLNYVQHPYFTDENVEKEKGIIGQEITMYDDDASFKVYLNALEAMYHENPVRLDIAGSVESISEINKDILYQCYSTFYHPSNMALVLCGNFEPEALIKQIKEKIVSNIAQGEIKRIYPVEPKEIRQAKREEKMEVSNPMYFIGIKDKAEKPEEMIKKEIAIEIILNLLLGKSSDSYQKLYQEGEIITAPEFDYEFSSEYAHILIGGQAIHPERIQEEFLEKIRQYQEKGLVEEDFKRIKKMVYGGYVADYNSISTIARTILADYFNGIQSFNYFENFDEITIEYANFILKEVFKKENMVLSIVTPK